MGEISRKDAARNVVDNDGLSKSARLVYMMWYLYENDVDEADRAKQLVAVVKHAGFSKASVLKCVRELVEAGIYPEGLLYEVQAAYESHKKSPEALKDEDRLVNEVFNVFYEGGNKAVPFGNTVERKAALSLIRERGFSEAVRLATLALEACGQPYAPVITTPAALWRKLKTLEAWQARKAVETPKKNTKAARI